MENYMTTKTSKLSQAMEAYKTGNYKTNAEFVQYLIDNLGMSKLGARTYAYNVKQKLGLEVMRMRLGPDVIEAAPKTKTKTPKAKKAPVAVEPTTVNEQTTAEDDPLAIPDFLQRPRTKAEGEVKSRKPSRKAMEKAIMQATAMTTSATVSNA